MKTLATTAAALAFTAAAALAQDSGPGEDMPLIWQSPNFKIYAYEGPKGLANMFLLTCPNEASGNNDITLSLYNLERIDLIAMRISNLRDKMKAIRDGYSEEYTYDYADGLINPDGSVISAHNYSEFGAILKDALSLPVQAQSAPLSDENVLRNIRNFAMNFCLAMS